ncbi:unnamed protein product [Tilletia laevis]|nr:unnamed protein product [Tilletia caries]CAD6947867.1 unnamed protein product [Tilletia caries]CAD6950079.1 unnamed protein product [Tilletia laevis]CAD6961079.1 unnamed protein product [Tilletia laevis]CAD6977576.1 unnamed protein product [Tilletia controversa]
MWDTAMMLDTKTGDSKSDSDAIAKLLTYYAAMAPIDIHAAVHSYHTPSGVLNLNDIITLARRFPSVWETSKSQILRAMGTDMKFALLFIKQCRLANLPETVWGTSLHVCTRVVAPPAEAELNDEAFQKALWGVSIDLPTPDLCQTSVARYMAVPATKTTNARSAVTAICSEDSRAFKSKRAVLEPLLLHWLQAMERDLLVLQKKCTDANNWIFSDGTIPGQPDLNDFLRSSQMSAKIVGGFCSIVEARTCASRITFKNSSGTAVADGRGKEAYVLITKGPSYAHQLEALHRQMKAQYDSFRAMVSQPDEGGPAKKQKLEPGVAM